MQQQYTLAVDVMGGDFGLAITIPGCLLFLRQQPKARLILVGDEAKIRAALEKHGANMKRLSILHASQVVDMDEAPQLALKNKKDSSMRLAIQCVKDNQAQAAVSAGNTGALMATARFVLRTISGINRPAIAKFLPAKDDHLTLMLDLGANVECTAEQLLQFAFMGSRLFSALNPKVTAPRIGLLNVGTENIKGTDTVRQTFDLLSKSQLNFAGNVEGDAVFSGDVDVVVADGFTGNIVLKTIEGAVKFMGGAIKAEFSAGFWSRIAAFVTLPVLKKFKAKLDPRRFNGAIFLGLRGIVIKSHGGTDAEGFCYALQEAYHEISADTLQKIEEGIVSAPWLVAEMSVKLPDVEALENDDKCAVNVSANVHPSDDLGANSSDNSDGDSGSNPSDHSSGSER